MNDKIEPLARRILPYFSSITIILAVFGLLIGFIWQRFSYQVIGGMFILIAVENFLIRIVHLNKSEHELKSISTDCKNLKNTVISLEKVMNKLVAQTPDRYDVRTVNEGYRLSKRLKMASASDVQDVFISCVTLYYLEHIKTFFEELDKNSTVRLLTTYTSDVEMLDQLCKMREQDFDMAKARQSDYAGIFEKFLNKHLAGKQNVLHKTAQRIIPCAFFAINIKKPSNNSVIEVDFYVPEKRIVENVISLTATYGSDLFNILYHQIKVLWDESIPNPNCISTDENNPDIL